MVFSCFAVYLRIIMHGLYHILYTTQNMVQPVHDYPRRYTAKQLKTIYYSLIHHLFTCNNTLFFSSSYSLFIYPPPPSTGGITVTSDDKACLDEGEFLNDVIIDFYLK